MQAKMEVTVENGTTSDILPKEPLIVKRRQMPGTVAGTTEFAGWNRGTFQMGGRDFIRDWREMKQAGDLWRTNERLRDKRQRCP